MGLNDDSFDGAKPKYYIAISHKKDGGMGYSKKQGTNKIWVPVKSVSGAITSFGRKWDGGSQTDRIAPHWQYTLTLSDNDGNYLFSFPEHLLFTTNILNNLLMVNKEREISIHVLGVDVSKSRVNLGINYKGSQEEVPRCYTEWDSELQTLTGVPPLEPIPNSDKKDSSKRNAFWFEKYKTVLFPKFNGGEEWKETSDQKPPAEETAPRTNIYEGTSAETKPAAVATTPATVTMYQTLRTKLQGMAPMELEEKWATVSKYSSEQITKKALTIVEWDYLVVLANQLFEEFRAMHYPNMPQKYFQTDGTIRTAHIGAIDPDFTDDLPF